jgi:hypothetical protein
MLLVVAPERERAVGRTRAWASSSSTVRFLVLQGLELELELESKRRQRQVRRRMQMQMQVVVVGFGFEAWRRARRLVACWEGFFLWVQFIQFFATSTLGRGEERRGDRDALDFGLEALLFFGRALDGAGVFRVRLSECKSSRAACAEPRRAG